MELIPTDHHQLLFFTMDQFREKFMHARDEIVQAKLKEEVRALPDKGVLLYWFELFPFPPFTLLLPSMCAIISSPNLRTSSVTSAL